MTRQKSVAASDVTIIPSPTSDADGQDGLTYHLLPSRAVAAGDSYNVEVGYTMSTPALTVNFLQESGDTAVSSGEDLPILEAVPVEDSDFNWPLLLIALGAIILVATAVWYFMSRQSMGSRRPAKPKPARRTAAAQASAAKGRANFCHNCGQPLQPEDKFCRQCGTAIKTK